MKEVLTRRKFTHDDYSTPKWLYNKLDEEFSFDFDPCPLHSKVDNLFNDWGKRNFVNPPYNRKVKEQFIMKAYEESLKGNLSVLLIPTSTSSIIFHTIIQPNAEIRFVEGRLKFEGKGSRWAAGFDSMIVIFKAKQYDNRHTFRYHIRTNFNINSPLKSINNGQSKK